MSSEEEGRVGAVVLAAGLSQRMGKPKMLLRWDDTSVIRRVVQTLEEAEIDPIVVVTGSVHEDVNQALEGLPFHAVFNPHYENGEMLISLQLGLRSMAPNVDAALIVLGDQPQMETGTVRSVVDVYREESPYLIVPSYEMRRGHPWLVDRALWADILDLNAPQTVRDFIQTNASAIRYLNVETRSVLADLDTPEDYDREKPASIE